MLLVERVVCFDVANNYSVCLYCCVFIPVSLWIPKGCILMLASFHSDAFCCEFMNYPAHWHVALSRSALAPGTCGSVSITVTEIVHQIGHYKQLSQMWPNLSLVMMMMMLSLKMVVTGNGGMDTCHITTTGQYPQQAHYFYHNGHDLPVIIEDSNRISNRITNRILKILLENIGGYASVEIQHCHIYDNQNITALLNRVSGRTKSSHCQPPHAKPGSIPDILVNMEVWMVAGFNKAPWLDTGELVDAGPLGPQGRMGWYLPTFIVEELWSTDQIMVDHWRALLIPKVVRRFSWWGQKELLQIKADYKRRAYKSPKCQENGRGLRRNCATLFASSYGVDAGILQTQVEGLGLYVDIIWLEDSLTAFVNSMLNSSHPVIFFNWQPDTLIASGQFTRINFPGTHTQHKNAPMDCDFPVNQLTKVVWGPFKTAAPEAFHIISKMSFSDLEYDQLIANASQHQSLSLNQIACRWIQENEHKWEKWLPTSLMEKPKIYLGGLFPLTGKSWAQPGLVEGARLALELVNEDVNTLPNHTLELLVFDTQCEYDVAMNHFISLVQMRAPPIAGILGTGCSDPAERIAALSKHFNMMMVSYGAEAQELSDTEKYPYFFRTIPPVQLYTHVYPDLFQAMGWGLVGALAVGGQELPEYHLTLQDRLQIHGISLIVRRKFLNNTRTPDIPQILKEFRSQNVRVIIADVFSNVAREVMCEAYKQKMTAHEGYVWFLPSWYPKLWFDVEYYNNEPNHHEGHLQRENVPCTTAQVEHAAEGHFVLLKALTRPPETFVTGGITVSNYTEMYSKRCGNAFVEESNFASFVYDAVWVYAKGLDSLLRQNQGSLETINTETTARAFRAAISNLSFLGVSGWIKFDGSDRHGDLLIHQVFSNETRIIGQYSPGTESTGGESVLSLDISKIRWLSPRGPTRNDPESLVEDCPIDAFRAVLGVSCTIAHVIVIVFVFFGFIIVVIAVLIVMKYKCDAKMRKFKQAHERIKELGLLNEKYSNILTVDDWEIPRKNIVLNREIGEGAFGTVMGGEMYKEREGWVAVAVKTLKLHHTMEEKLDFFSEVDMMKCFKHENIVQLLGVCTRKEPIYAVMEFLLHGDLKTYLLSRRSLVGQGVKEAEDVKAENLTQMAVDIAQGLSYLHCLKYVHRDLACRNCLVHANKTVKIGDFGMTRHISSVDYYRFSRKGMLPVRWMAPEALKDGIYSAKSDIWSYGVLVFEIVTFGSFPYQGLSNKEVFDFVSKGNQLMLPDKCPDALKSFIHWCMSVDPGYRPDLDDILSYLNYSPAFLTPCLDVPTTSVVHEDTDSLEMQLPVGMLTASSNQSPGTPAFFLNSSQRQHSWQDKLKYKRKTFSVPGLVSFGKSSKSSLANRSPASSSCSSSLSSANLHSSSICGLHSCGIGGGWGLGASGDEAIADRSDRVKSEASFSKELENSKPERKNEKKDVVCSAGIETHEDEHRKSIESDHRGYSSTTGTDKRDVSSGYISQSSKGESKQICQTVTSL